MIACTTPYLDRQPRIIYDWRTEPSAGAHFAFDLQDVRHNFFWADRPDIFEVFCTVKDTVSGYESTAHRTVRVCANVNITLPQDSAKFCFTADSVGVLACTAAAVVTPAWLADSLEWGITPIAGSNLTTIPSPPRGDSVKFYLTNLPDSNNQFGMKYITASIVGTNVRDSVMVKAFYPKYAFNNPSDTLPNWYYYWRMTSAYVWGRQQFGGDSCTFRKAGYYLPGDTLFCICDSAASQANSECDSTSWSGIDLFAATELHENTHLNDWWTFWPNGYIQALDMDAPTPNDTIPGDGVPDSLEGPGHRFPNFDPTIKDTDRDNHYDFDDLGYDMECNRAKGSADTVDWCNPGHQ